MTDLINLSKTARQTARAYAHASRNNLPVVVVPGVATPPIEVGESFRYETKGGTYIRYPSAYKKKGFSNMVYVASTSCVEVGEGWLRAHSLV
jgi:hypothetical protein